MAAQGRHWCFTLNNPTEAEKAALVALADSVNVLVIGEEIGECGTPHLQGHIGFSGPKRFSAVKSVLGDRCHIEKSADPKRSILYCRKDGRLLVDKDDRKQGARTDLDSVFELARSGCGIREIVEQYPREYIKYHGGIDKCVRIMQPKLERWTETEVIVLLGPTGCGKTRFAVTFDPYRIPVPSTDTAPVWFDGYRGQDTVLLDDYRGTITYDLLLHITDGYPMAVPVKGGFVERNWTRVLITTNYRNVGEWHPSKDLEPLLRRITRQYNMWEGDVCPVREDR